MKVLSTLTVFFWAVFCVSAHAVTIKVERLSDTKAVISGSGVLPSAGPAGAAHVLSFGDSVIDPFSIDPGLGFIRADISSSMYVGERINYANSFENSSAPYFYFGWSERDTLYGSIEGVLEVTLASGTWADVGTTGTLFWGAFWRGDAIEVGTWEITAVPVPASLPLMISLLGGMAFVGHRRKKATV